MSNRPESGSNSPQRPEAAAAGSDQGNATEEAFFAAAEASPPLDDEEDPELVALPRPRRRRRHPLVSLAVLLLSVYLLWFLRTDLLFFMQPRTPADKGQVDEALARGTLEPNTHVKITGAPDRKHALLLEARFGGFESFVRLHQGGNRLFVQSHREQRVTDKEVTATHAGQLVRFADLPYAQALRENFKSSLSLAHDLDFTAIKGPLAAGSVGATAEVKDRRGDLVRLAPDSQLWINVAFPGEWLVQFSRRAYATDAEPRRALDHVGLPYAADTEASRMFHRFVVLADAEQARKLMASFKDPGLHAGVVRRQLSYTANWEQLRVKGNLLVIDARDPTFPSRFARQGDQLVPVKDQAVQVPAEDVLYLTTSSPFEVADDALVLIAGRSPGDNWHYALLGLLLLSFAGVNGVVLVLRLRERSRARPA